METTAKQEEYTKQENIEGALRGLEESLAKLRTLADRISLGDVDRTPMPVTGQSTEQSPYVLDRPLAEFLDGLPEHINEYEEEVRILTSRMRSELF